MTPLERAARAVIEETGAYAIARVEGEPAAWLAEGGVRSEEHFRDIARAVLEAIREPSEEMEMSIARAIQDTLPLDSGTDPPDASVMVGYGVVKAAVAAMIDAALKEG